MKLKSIIATAAGAALLVAMPAFAQQTGKIPHSSDSVKATGEGNSVGMRGRAVELAGTSLKVGDKLPSAML